MKIAIFGGSFNPVHKGHIMIAKDAINMLNLDKLYFVPANKNPFKKVSDYVSNEHRIEMLKMVLENKMEVSDFETKRGGNSYTIDTVKYFKNKFPNDELFLLIGSDNVTKLNKWKDIDEIASLVKIVVFNRNNKYSKINLKKYNCLKLKNEFHDFSSSQYRSGNLSMVEENVQEYIGKNFLYFEDIAKSFLSIERFKHLRFTAEFAAELAKNNSMSIKKAYQAGYMHDITKEWSEQKAYSFLKKYGLNEQNLLPYQLHQTTAYYWLKDKYKYPDLEVLEAIKIHTSMALEMTELAKILFIADKICQGRTWKGVQNMRKIALENLNEGLKIVTQVCALDWNIEKGIIFTDEQEKIYKKWAK
ncbi:nicotinate-nucleotide adenylyltransferase [Metamycoplasma neophronis]|uniref:Probable nicotinate-nucleotide adenylyltransferase n=1 Tax=Metamycoplasma neophronis TaxID=872983 RepID=A0ABY2Z546_9BACT|nr:nicotinate-nucleotide adenylyltransferase [Metamycoplasma neophronis]TPR54358.1 nicotinate-nucleotide adenylyltransferase [Metamycoplasma neophronis]